VRLCLHLRWFFTLRLLLVSSLLRDFLLFSEFYSSWFGPMLFCSWSVTKSCLTLCHPMDCSTPGFPILHHLLEFAQTLIFWVSDAIQPSHPPSPPSLPAFSLSQHQGLFQWVGFWHQVAKSKLFNWFAGQLEQFFLYLAVLNAVGYEVTVNNINRNIITDCSTCGVH